MPKAGNEDCPEKGDDPVQCQLQPTWEGKGVS